ncbi:MAG: DUF3426 domain-containing protein [Gammaproteobacteria bacterium]|jgi:predicted Zn finger-like uncharacterized protein|nr:DUF3426 domain-containing protein [Gammaproteobacteria bacterium]
MYTRCPACQAVYELRAGLLAEASGVVRCGNCGKTFNSLSELFERHPESDAEPLRGKGMPPMLEHPDMVQAELPVDTFDDDEGSEAAPLDWLESEPSSRAADARRLLWPSASAALLLLLLVQFWLLWQTPGSIVDRWLGGSSQPVGNLDPNQVIQIVSRDLHAHPSLDDAVVISASLRNQAEATVPFPIIEVRFFDASQQVLGVRRVTPEEYLGDPDRIERGLASGLMMPLLLEFVVGTSRPAGFQMRFH